MRSTLRVGLVALSLGSVVGLAMAFQPEPPRPGRQPGRQPGQGQPGQPGGRQPGGFGDPAQFVERLMENDANGDGKLSRDEVPERFGAFFERVDGNSDGFLDREELETFAASRPGRGPGGPGGDAPEGGPVDMHQSMERAGRALRGLQRSRFDAQSRGSDLEQVQAIEGALVAAKSVVDSAPMSPTAKEAFGDDREEFTTEFRLALIRAIQASLELEMMVLQNDQEGARDAFTALREAQEDGHDLFQP
ncbi:MAG: hypothetical protein H6811_01760 [Phycisphaeraceae bacterium]|nr:hypothetical protein [Phycisphaeraceae bacterium]